MIGSFSQDLARLFGLPPERGGAIVQQLARVVQDRLNTAGEVVIEGFGTFRRNEDGSLSFEPEEVLQEAVNHRFSGMKPIVTSAPKRQEEEDAVPEPGEELSDDLPPFIPIADIEDEEELPLPETVDQQEIPADLPEDEGEIMPPFIPKEETEVSDSDASTDLDDDLENIIEGVWTQSGSTPPDPEKDLGEFEPFEEADFLVVHPADIPPTDEPALPNEEITPPDEREPEIDKDDAIPIPIPTETQAPDSDISAEPPTSDPKPRPKRRRRSAWPILLLFVLLALAVLAFFWMFDDRTTAPQDIAEAPSEEVISETPTPEPAEEIIEEEAVEVESSEEPEILEEPAVVDPLRGDEPIDASLGGVTWIAYSEASRAAADRRVANFREQGFRSAVIPSTVRGAQRFRVAIGQFSSIEEAEAHRAELPSGLPSDIWISRL